MPTRDPHRIERIARLRWIPIPKMKVNPLAQRELNQGRVDHLVANFDPEQIGTPTVNERDGWFYVIDGNHRIECMKGVGWGDQSVQCWTYVGLTEEEEAEKFLVLNDYLAVSSFDRFTKGVKAGRAIETDIDRIVRSNGCVVTRENLPGAVGAVFTLTRIYKRAGAETLGRTLRLAVNAYGDAGLDSVVLDGLGYLCQRYNGDLRDDEAAKRLGASNKAKQNLLEKAEVIRRSVGGTKGQAVAAAAVEIINAGKGSTKLPSWWKSDS